jgi:hypothetical protein
MRVHGTSFGRRDAISCAPDHAPCPRTRPWFRRGPSLQAVQHDFAGIAETFDTTVEHHPEVSPLGDLPQNAGARGTLPQEVTNEPHGLALRELGPEELLYRVSREVLVSHSEFLPMDSPSGSQQMFIKRTLPEAGILGQKECTKL